MGPAKTYADEGGEETKENEDRDPEREKRAMWRVLEVTCFLLALNTAVVLLFTTVKARSGGGVADLFGSGRTARCSAVHIFATAEDAGGWVTLLIDELDRRGVDATSRVPAVSASQVGSALAGVPRANATCALHVVRGADIYAAASPAAAAAAAATYANASAALDAAAAAVGGAVVAATPLPSDAATPAHAAAILHLNAALGASAYPVVDLWAATAAGDGRWRDDLDDDADRARRAFDAFNASLGALFLGS